MYPEIFLIIATFLLCLVFSYQKAESSDNSLNAFRASLNSPAQLRTPPTHHWHLPTNSVPPDINFIPADDMGYKGFKR